MANYASRFGICALALELGFVFRVPMRLPNSNSSLLFRMSALSEKTPGPSSLIRPLWECNPSTVTKLLAPAFV